MDWFDEQRQGGVGELSPLSWPRAHLTIEWDVWEGTFHQLLDERVRVTCRGTM